MAYPEWVDPKKIIKPTQNSQLPKTALKNLKKSQNKNSNSIPTKNKESSVDGEKKTKDFNDCKSHN